MAGAVTRRGLAIAVTALLMIVCGAIWWRSANPPLPPLVLPTRLPAETAWEQWGATAGGTRYTPAAQITPANAAHLQAAWRYSTGELARRPETMLANSSNEMTPILEAGSLIACTPFARVIALDPATGRERWVFDPKIDPRFRVPDQYVCRGVSQWRDVAATPGSACAERILLATADMRLIALDTRTGRPCAGFGTGGAVTIDPGPLHHPGEVKLAGPAAIANDSVVVGTSVLDNVRAAAPRGTVRAFDARSGRLIWTFDPIPPTGRPDRDWLGDRHAAGAANVWSVIAADPALGLVYLPTSSASTDYYGGLRPGDNRHANSVVALDARSGRLVWAQQLVHHDAWDYDTPAQPTLIDLDHDGARVPALVQPTKQAYLYVFDRRDGRSLFPIDEVAVPQGGVPGERLSSTQPRPRLPPPLVPQSIREDQAWGFTRWDRGRCRDLIARYRSEGLFTPVSERGTITYPAASGGANWGGGAIDPARQLFFINTSRVASVISLMRRPAGAAGGSVKLSATEDVSPMAGTPYEVKREWLLSPLGAPCTPPPWGGLTAIDLQTGKKVWDVPLGTIRDRMPIPLPIDLELGTPNIGGPVATRGGVLFIAATMDRYLRAIDMGTGRELWRDRLPGGSQATPMSYMTGGRQFVVIAVGQHMWFQTPRSDEIIAYALPIKSSPAARAKRLPDGAAPSEVRPSLR